MNSKLKFLEDITEMIANNEKGNFIALNKLGLSPIYELLNYANFLDSNKKPDYSLLVRRMYDNLKRNSQSIWLMDWSIYCETWKASLQKLRYKFDCLLPYKYSISKEIDTQKITFLTG